MKLNLYHKSIAVHLFKIFFWALLHLNRIYFREYSILNGQTILYFDFVFGFHDASEARGAKPLCMAMSLSYLCLGQISDNFIFFSVRFIGDILFYVLYFMCCKICYFLSKNIITQSNIEITENNSKYKHRYIYVKRLW